MSNLTVVMYHYVRDIECSRYTGIKGLELSLFVEQLKYFESYYNIVTMEQVLDAVANDSASLPKNALLLTFDDGYAEHFTQVYPLLKEFGFQGSFYVPAKTVLEHEVLDVNKIHFTLASASNPRSLVSEIQKQIDKYKNEYSLNSFEDYYNSHAKANRFDCADIIFVKRMLQHVLPETLRNTITKFLFEQFVGIDEKAFARELYMNENQLKQLVRDGMHIGCHGYDHYWWNKLTKEELNQEISRSKSFLGSLGCEMSAWTACYPYGSSSPDVVSLLEKHGCRLAFTTEVRVARLGKDHSLLVPRLDTNDLPKHRDAIDNNWLKHR